MSRILTIWRSWSVQRRALTLGAVLLVAAGGGIFAYAKLKRPPDVSNPAVDFVVSDKPEGRQVKPKDNTVDWPTYGYTDARTRYFPSRAVRPPFASSDWSIQFGKLLEFSPIVVDDRIYVMDIDANFYAVDAEKGKVIWEKDVGGLNATSPAYAQGKLYATNLEPGQALSLRAKDGKMLWKRPLPGRSESSPLVFRDKLVIFGCECGTVFALDAEDGSVEWQVETAGAIKAALALNNGNVYGGNYAGEAFAIDADSGNVEWKISTSGSSFGRGGGIYSTPAVAYGRVYFGSIDSRVYSLDEDTGSIAWSKSTGAEVYSGPAVADTPGTPPSVYIGSADDNIYALDARTGSVRWQKDIGGDVTGAGTVIGDVFYVSVIGEGRGTVGFDVGSGAVRYENDIGEYNPAITDGERLFLTGYSELRAFPPQSLVKKRKQERKREKAAKKAAKKAEAPPAAEETAPDG